MQHRRLAHLAAAGLLAVGFAASAPAAEPDPDWPCVQRKVATLSAAQMWPQAAPEGEPENVRELARRAQAIASRRVPVAEATALAEDVVAGLDPEERARLLGHLFGAIVDRINRERAQVIAGIGRYSRRQASLAELVEAKQLELARLETLPENQRDPQRIEELRTTLVWDARIFRERQQALAYVCETPTLLERRAFELGRALGGLL